MKKIFLIIIFVAALIGGSLFVRQLVFAQAIGGKILSFDLAGCSVGSPTCNRHMIGPPMPSFPPGVICPICMQFAGIGRWFLGRAIGGVVTIGGLGGF